MRFTEKERDYMVGRLKPIYNPDTTTALYEKAIKVYVLGEEVTIYDLTSMMVKANKK